MMVITNIIHKNLEEKGGQKTERTDTSTVSTDDADSMHAATAIPSLTPLIL